MAVFFIPHLNILNKSVAGVRTVVEPKLESVNADVRKNGIRIWFVSGRKVCVSIGNISGAGKNVNLLPHHLHRVLI